MKKILIILPFIPYPITTGGIIGVFEMIDHLRNKFEISLLVPLTDKRNLDSLKVVWPNVLFYSYSLDNFMQKVFRKLSKVFYQLSLYSLSLYFHKGQDNSIDNLSGIYINTIPSLTKLPFSFDVSPNLIKIAKQLIVKNDYDFVQIEYAPVLPLISFIPKSINTIFVHHELRYVCFERMFEPKDRKNEGLNDLILSHLKGHEIELLKHFKKIITVSEVDKKILSENIDDEKIIVSPSTIKINNTDSNEYIFNNQLFFLGGSNHPPNVDALKWFLENCWNELLEKNEKLCLKIIGVWQTKEIQQFKKYKQIEFLGFVEQLKSVLKNGIMVIPIRIGSGMRMKIIDSINHDIPFVATTIGAEGLDFKDGIDCFIANEPDDFTNKILLLAKSEKLQKDFIQNSKIILLNKYSYEKLVNIREKIYLT